VVFNQCLKITIKPQRHAEVSSVFLCVKITIFIEGDRRQKAGGRRRKSCMGFDPS